MIDPLVVELSRLQFAATAMYHFLFVPLTLGLSFLMAIMESVYVMTGREVWRQATLFWGTLFGINFAMGVATGIVMEFQFGMNWSYYSHYVGDVFGAPLAIEGLMAFFLEATFIGLFFFGWDRLQPVGHLAVTWLVALGANFSALWILIANGWMQNPVGATFNPDTMRMEVTDFVAVIFNPVAQAKFVHTVSAGYVTGAVFVLAISALFLLRGRHVELAKRSMVVAASFGLAVGAVGRRARRRERLCRDRAPEDEDRRDGGDVGDRAGAGRAHALRHSRRRRPPGLRGASFPCVLGLITTRSLDRDLPGITELIEHAATPHPQRHRSPTRPLRRDPCRPHGRRGARRPSPRTRPISAMRCCSSNTAPTSRTPPARRSSRPPSIPCPTSGRCSGASASWSASASSTSPSSPCWFWKASRHTLETHRALLWVALWTLPLPLARHRSRLAHRRIWPPALGGRGRAADLLRRLGAAPCSISCYR